MSRLATRRLIDAAAGLEPAERALLNLWVNRGFGDPALARMTGLTLDALAARRELIVGHLSVELGLPPDRVRDALKEIFDSAARERESPVGNHGSAEPGVADADAGGVQTGAEHAGTESPSAPAPPAPAASPTPPLTLADQETTAAPERHRSRRLVLGLLPVLIVIALLITLSGGGKSGPGSRSTSSGLASSGSPTASPSPSPAPPAKPGAVPRTIAGRGVRRPLAALPGGLAHARGFARVVGSRPGHLKLKLSLRGLPAARRGHYEAWLYNSILDSAPLGRVRAGARTVTLALPRDARRFRWIDISFQPHGAKNHSGESELRASNPAAGKT